MADVTDSSARLSTVSLASKPDDAGEKLCGVCKVPVSIHVGKPDIGKCLGGAFTRAFESFVKTVNGLSGELQAERTEARDREQRLKAQITEMQGQLTECNEQVAQCKDKSRQDPLEAILVIFGRRALFFFV